MEGPSRDGSVHQRHPGTRTLSGKNPSPKRNPIRKVRYHFGSSETKVCSKTVDYGLNVGLHRFLKSKRNPEFSYHNEPKEDTSSNRFFWWETRQNFPSVRRHTENCKWNRASTRNRYRHVHPALTLSVRRPCERCKPTFWVEVEVCENKDYRNKCLYDLFVLIPCFNRVLTT